MSSLTAHCSLSIIIVIILLLYCGRLLKSFPICRYYLMTFIYCVPITLLPWLQVVLVGNAGVGKTCLVRRFTQGMFPPGQVSLT